MPAWMATSEASRRQAQPRALRRVHRRTGDVRIASPRGAALAWLSTEPRATAWCGVVGT